MNDQKRVAIIGAGLSGLAATKCCLEEGLEPVCFEQHDSIGGLWYYTEEYREGQGARSYAGLTSNHSKEMMAYSDFPFPSDVPSFVPHARLYEYANNYCNSFGLNKHIHLNTKVLSIRKSEEYNYTGMWELEREDLEKGIISETFDAIVVCCGYFKKSRFPDIQGIDTFQGSIEHSMTFKDGTKYKNQRVLIVGNKHSCGDVACAASNFADQVYISIGKGTWILPKYGKRGTPFDLMLLRRCNFWDLSNVDKLLMGMCNDRIDHKLNGLSPSSPPSGSPIMVSEEIQNQIMTGRVKVVGDLVRIGPREAEFRDGTTVQNLDAIVFATGYDFSLDILNTDFLGGGGMLNLYKMVFPIKLTFNTLAIIGCLDLVGPVPSLFELQARLACMVFSGNLQLPSKEIMIDDVDRRNKFLFKTFGRYKYRIAYLAFRDELATLLGVTPSWWDLIKAGPRLAYLYYYGPAFPYYDRVWGPHSWSGARKAIDNALEHGHYVKQLRKAQEPLNIYQQRSYLMTALISALALTLIFKSDVIISSFKNRFIR